MSWIIWVLFGIIALVIIVFLIKKLKGEDNPYSEDSFLSRTRNKIDNGCKKLLERIRGC